MKVTIMMKFYNVQPDGTTEEIPAKKSELNSERVVIVVDDDTEKIYIWKGNSAPVRLKFIAARQASAIRMQKGMEYKVVSVDEGEELSDFLGLFDASRATKSVKKPPVPKSVPPPSVPSIKPEPTPKVAAHKPSPKTRTVETRPPPRPVSVSGPAYPASTTHSRSVHPTSTVPAAPARPVSHPVSQPVRQSVSQSAPFDYQKAIEELKKIKVPPGLRREMIIIGDTVYTVTEKKKLFFGEAKIERSIEKIDSPPEGEFFVEDYTVRVLIRNGRVLGMEFLKPESPDLVAEKIEPEAKQHISELVSFFEEIKSSKKK